MRGAVRPLLKYDFMAWCLGNGYDGQFYVYIFMDLYRKGYGYF